MNKILFKPNLMVILKRGNIFLLYVIFASLENDILSSKRVLKGIFFRGGGGVMGAIYS